jgi:hypothetical protein
VPRVRIVLGFIAATAGATGCAMRIAPPANPRDPVTVYIADYGYHASLLLPDEPGVFQEWAYGWWEWFALNRNRWHDALTLLLFPGRGALGQRTLPTADDGTPLLPPVERRLALRVEREKAAALLARLRAEYAAEVATEVYNDQLDLHLVHSRDPYWMGYNCNGAIAAWLERLGCRVGLARQVAVFEIVTP